MAKICMICDKPIFGDVMEFLVPGIREKVIADIKCFRIFTHCKGDFSKLPEGRLKRSIEHAIPPDKLISNSGKCITKKQLAHILEGLKISKVIGYKRILVLAVDFYGLEKPSDNQYYTINPKFELILMEKGNYIQ